MNTINEIKVNSIFLQALEIAVPKLEGTAKADVDMHSRGIQFFYVLNYASVMIELYEKDDRYKVEVEIENNDKELDVEKSISINRKTNPKELAKKIILAIES